jgi:hypothetical protein
MMRNIDSSDDSAGSVSSPTLDVRLPVERPGRSRPWILVLVGVMLFASGVICGAAAVRLPLIPRTHANWSGILQRVTDRMQSDLALTEAQRKNVEQVMQAHQPALERIRLQTTQEMRAELQQLIEDLSVHLTPEQASHFRSEAEPAVDRNFPDKDPASQSAASVN